MRSPFLPLLVCALFSLFALAGVLFGEAPRTSLLLYYCLLLLNTFFSVRVFSSITPPNALQAVFDAILVLIYAGLAFSFASVVNFTAISAGLFLISALKYVHLKRIVSSYQTLLQRKIRINGLGVLLSLGALAFALTGYSDAAGWLLCGVFALANFYVLFLKPMYRLDQ